jgi:hypothetical protein
MNGDCYLGPGEWYCALKRVQYRVQPCISAMRFIDLMESDMDWSIATYLRVLNQPLEPEALKGIHPSASSDASLSQ